ncbi:DNA mismatch repair protein MutS [Lutibacter sp. TH_r2]|uniref:MutS-related protein n=1 Tax=Lutibacter sp. TH_r2 TaxID=3082083 RepID=UPI002953B9D5|nr:DNA mismatch repair protein MutS [Lutibacter sp. TH_r2]MDV7188160.1 DNA mismatch repair protein MutS [Lutibacter sp. TH_r2]
MNWVLGLAIIITVYFLISNYSNKKKYKKLKKELLKNWGKPKKNSYYNFNLIANYFNNYQPNYKPFHRVSDKVKSDLDIDEVFKSIDRTTSKVGQQFLYFKFRTIGSLENLVAFGKLTNAFKKNKSNAVKCQLILSKLSSHNSYDLEKLITEKPIAKPKYLKLIYASSIGSILFIILGFFNPIFFLFLLPLFFINTIFHYKNKENVTYYISAVNQLSKALKVGKQLSNFNEVKQHYTYFSFLKKVNSIQLKTEFIGFENYLVNEYALPIWLLIELIKIQFMVEYIFFFSFVDAVTKEKKSINKLFQFIGEIDSAISVASLKSDSLQLCEPEFTNKKQVVVNQISHPLIENCVLNNVLLNNKSLLLTGSNMSGKTTFIRTVAINAILAQTLNICFAKEYNAPYFKIYSSIRITDDLLDNTSYYLEEVLTIKELISKSNTAEPCLFILDEIFKGTNTVERISGGKAILSYLNKGNNVVLVSTHDIELTDLLKTENYQLFHFSEKIENQQLIFDHKLKEGKLKTRNAIKILELYKYPSEIIDDARDIETTFN